MFLKKKVVWSADHADAHVKIIRFILCKVLKIVYYKYLLHYSSPLRNENETWNSLSTRIIGLCQQFEKYQKSNHKITLILIASNRQRSSYSICIRHLCLPIYCVYIISSTFRIYFYNYWGVNICFCYPFSCMYVYRLNKIKSHLYSRENKHLFDSNLMIFFLIMLLPFSCV